jgi:predicted TIM-barrel enzyme
MWDGEYTIGLKHLKSLNYLPAECEQMELISDRITRLRQNENLEEAGRAVLKYLGELKRPYLTQVEQKLLSLIELECEMEG